MFERYTERARRTIFLARYEASNLGSPEIETEHLFLGMLREDTVLANRLLRSQDRIGELRDFIKNRGKIGPKISTSVDLPVSSQLKRALAYGAEECERLDQEYIDTEHLLLGLLREEKCVAAQLLRNEGITLEQLRALVLLSQTELERGKSLSIAGLDQWIAEREAEGRWTIEQRSAGYSLYAADQTTANLQAPSAEIPLVWIEVIERDGFSSLRQRCENYVADGVDQVWLLDPSSKRAYTITEADGLREFKGEVLQIANARLGMDLRKIFD